MEVPHESVALLRKPCLEVPHESVELLRKIVRQNEVIIGHLRLLNGLPPAPSAAPANPCDSEAEEITSGPLSDDDDDDGNE
ncbi:MAG: hypothetical protein M1839_002091 [Geoglossum umbratile]|nr:MAG: hypothetical protein M1839_002091 [Geoglossum umbratile]